MNGTETESSTTGVDQSGIGRRLFIAATGNHSVEVLNVNSGEVVERITGLGKPHGLAWVAGEKKLFVADGTLADLRIYSGSPLKLLAEIPLSDDADDMVYDEGTRLLYVGHGGGSAAIPGRVAVIDAHDNKLVANLPASAHPEALDIDPQGKRIFANIADSAEVLVIDAATHATIQTWKISRAKDNVPAAYDADDHALLIGCRTPGTAISLDASTGNEVNSQPSASGADDFFYESSTHHPGSSFVTRQMSRLSQSLDSQPGALPFGRSRPKHRNSQIRRSGNSLATARENRTLSELATFVTNLLNHFMSDRPQVSRAAREESHPVTGATSHT